MKIFHFLSLFSFLAIFDVSADSNNYFGSTDLSNKHLSYVTITGPANLNNLTSESLRIIGPLQFDKLAVSGEAHIIGPVNGKNGKFDRLTITGPLALWESEINNMQVIGHTNLESVTVSGKTNIIGNFEAKKSKLHNLIVTSNEIKLHDTVLNNITVKKNNDSFNSQRKQMLEIQGKTIINGDINFESGVGEILLSKNSKINGKVEGAKVQNLD